MVVQFDAHRGDKKLSMGYICSTKGIYLTYFDLEIRGASRNKELSQLFNNQPNNLFPIERKSGYIRYRANSREELLDFICGNSWPEEMEEFLQLIVQELTNAY